MAIVGVSAAALYGPVALSPGVASPSTYLMLTPSGLCALAVAVMRTGEFRKRRGREVVERAVAEGVCAHCERPLRSIPARSDGALICDCCGAAWAYPAARK